MEPELPLSEELARVFARVPELVLSEETAASVLRVVARLAQEICPGTAGAGVSVVDRAGRWLTVAATDELVEHADLAQYRAGAGPCLAAWSTRAAVRVDDLCREPRWPQWSRRAHELGARAALSVPLVAGDSAVGAVTVYGAAPECYGTREESLLGMFAAQAAVLVANTTFRADAERLTERLRAAVRARDAVNIAKGILMARDGVDEEEAFLQLAGLARDRGTGLPAVAEDLVATTRKRRR
ncbi:GAF and ANTAR domain-containing protein [Amycolatopsis sp. NPDC004368]